jgi:integrase
MAVRREKRRDPKSGATEERWLVDILYRHPDGRRERIRKVSPVSTRRGAEEYERQLRHSLLDGTFGQKKEVPSFEEFVDDRWWPVYPASAGNRPNTVREKEIHLRVHLKPAIGKVPLDKVRGEIVARLFAVLRKAGLSEKSVKNVKATLRRILASAVDWGYLLAVPPLPRVKVPESRWDFLTPEESAQVLSVTKDPDNSVLLLFALHTGARAGEQIAIEWGDVDWRSRKIIFRRSSTRGLVGPTKSGRERKVPMTGALERALKSTRHLRSQLVFCDGDGTPLKLDFLHERLWTSLRRAGLRRIRWHDLRHTFASQLMMAGVPIRQVQDWMGHSTITMTMRYAHLAPDGGADLIRALEMPIGHGTLMAPESTASAVPKVNP